MNAQKLAAALRAKAETVQHDPNLYKVGWSLIAVADVVAALEDEPTPSPAPDVVREALEAVDWFWSRCAWDDKGKTIDDDARAARSKVRAALAALDAPAEPETLPEWVSVGHRGSAYVTLKGGCVHLLSREFTPEDLDRIATACRIRAAQLRKGEK